MAAKRKYNTEEERKEANRLSKEKYRKKNREKLKKDNKLYYNLNTAKIKEYRDEYREKPENKEKIKENRKKRYWANVDNAKKDNKKYRDNNSDKEKIRIDKWLKSHPDYHKKRYENNVEKYKKAMKKWRNANPIYEKEYRKINIETIRSNQNKTSKKRKSIDALYKLSCNLRTKTSDIFRKKGYPKRDKRTHEILGCTFLFIKSYIEAQWLLPHNLDNNGKVWMNWNNYGKYKKNILYYGWDVDHIVPLSSAKTEEKLLELCKYTNLQPLCSYTNRYIKKDRLDWINND